MTRSNTARLTEWGGFVMNKAEYNAAKRWVGSFNSIPTDMVRISLKNSGFSWREITYPAKGDSVYVYDMDRENSENYGEIVSYNAINDTYHVHMDDFREVDVSEDDLKVLRDDEFPTWGFMFQFEEVMDKDWLSNQENIRKLSECGFRVYYSDRWGYFFGIDGGGYDFYEKHWLPLYEARGLKWHLWEA